MANKEHNGYSILMKCSEYDAAGVGSILSNIIICKEVS